MFPSTAPAWLLPLILKAANLLLHWLFNSADIYIDHTSAGCPFCEIIKEVIE